MNKRIKKMCQNLRAVEKSINGVVEIGGKNINKTDLINKRVADRIRKIGAYR